MADDGSPSNQPRPSSIDLLLEVPNAYDSHAPSHGIDSRLTVGSPRTNHSPTRTDADVVQSVLKAIPEAQRPTFSGDVTVLPAADAANADIKRSLRYDGRTGFGFASNGQVTKYLGGDEVTRIIDGSFRVYAVDQPPAPAGGGSETSASSGGEAASGGEASGPKLSYFRIGKAELQLGTDAQNKAVEGSGTPLPASSDRMAPAKYNSGIGAYTKGQFNLYAEGKTNLITDEEFSIVSKGYQVTSYGPLKTLTFEGVTETAGETQGTAKLSSAEWRFEMPDGWYKQGYERNRKLEFSTGNTGEVKIAAGYGLSLGLSFEHKIAAGMETGYAATVQVKGETSVKVTSEGFASETPFGKFEVAKSAELTGVQTLSIGCGKLVDVAFVETMKKYVTVLRAAVATQNAAFLAYNAALADKAQRTVVPAGKEIEEIDDYDQEGFATAFKQGPKVYEAAISLSAISCTAGIVLAAVQAGLSAAPDVDGTPSIKMTPFTMKLAVGPTTVTMTSMGIYLNGVTLGMKGVSTVVNSTKTSFMVV